MKPWMMFVLALPGCSLMAQLAGSSPVPAVSATPAASCGIAPTPDPAAPSVALRLAIAGPGYFSVRHGACVAYTRCGSIALRDGVQFMIHGEDLLPPVILPRNFTQLQVGGSGLVTGILSGATSSVPIGQINTFVFENPGGLKDLGGNVFAPTSSSGEPRQFVPGAVNGWAGTLEATDSAC